ncbi:unnamed protein product [Danaus chrysippus]|uniref:(African queen) hypothetical protein n=1 Tax=Danaus chrysippus TaxID=151541 RepID=A0A8J2R4W0_9NEOP|nr:unnamed protein product [Danaus chrysippus]
MFWLTIFVLAIVTKVQCQLTAQSSVAPELRECYTDRLLIDRNNLPPMTIQVLIDIIQQVEDNPNVNVDLRQLVILLLQTYRQDGIEYHQPETNMASPGVLPFSPTFHSFHRHRIVQSRIIQGNQQVLPNNTLNSYLKCTLHHMLSTVVDARLRGNENQCNQLSQYRALRTSRDLTQRLLKDEVEILDLKAMSSVDTNGQMRHNPKDDVEYNGVDGLKSERQLLGDSQCPLLGGVVYTRWGAVSAGNVLSGIAGGAQLQRVPVRELVKGSVLEHPNVQEYVTSTYPTTLSGDLAEAVLIQTRRGNPSVSIGAAGNWNSTQAPRYFMLHSRTNLEMTDPEIRGDVDGFVLGSIVTSALESSSSLKLSQLLDMYYSPRNGVFDPTRRACNRRDLIQEFITNNNLPNLISETYTFSAVLDTNMLLPGTIMRGLQDPVASAVNNFQTYTSNNLNDLNCVVSETSLDYRLKTNLYIVLDLSWPYQSIYPAISYLLDSIEVGKYGSSVTLLNAFDGSVIVNTTFSLSEFHSNYTQQTHWSLPSGVNLESTLTNIRISMHSRLENERIANYVGGNSTVLLFLINTAINNNQAVWEQTRILNETVPDLRILFATSTNQFDRIWNLVRDMHNDISVISLTSDGTNVENNMNTVLTNIRKVGRRVINPACGSTYSDTPSGTRQFDDYVEPGYVNFYSISPNYFFHNNDNRKIRISRTGAGVGNLIVCWSRMYSQPRQNSSVVVVEENAVTCQTLTSGNVEIRLQHLCSGFYTINSCPFFYFSVQSVVPTPTTLSAICTENACRFPYNIRYQVQIEEFGCYSSGASIGVSIGLLLVTIFLNLL